MRERESRGAAQGEQQRGASSRIAAIIAPPRRAPGTSDRSARASVLMMNGGKEDDIGDPFYSRPLAAPPRNRITRAAQPQLMHQEYRDKAKRERNPMKPVGSFEIVTMQKSACTVRRSAGAVNARFGDVRFRGSRVSFGRVRYRQGDHADGASPPLPHAFSRGAEDMSSETAWPSWKPDASARTRYGSCCRNCRVSAQPNGAFLRYSNPDEARALSRRPGGSGAPAPLA